MSSASRPSMAIPPFRMRPTTLTLFDVMGVSKPVTIGAAAPCRFLLRVLGSSSMAQWYLVSQVQHDLTSFPTDAPAAIAAAARANPDMTLLTLGPLTNVAEAVRRFPQDLQRGEGRGTRWCAWARQSHPSRRDECLH